MTEKFFDAIRNDPRAKELIKAMPAPKDDTEAAESYVRLAKELGYDLSFKEILQGLKSFEKAQKDKSDKVVLDAEDLENVSGGANPGCDDTHNQGEWCWFTDSCSYLITYYDDVKKPDGQTSSDDEENCKNEYVFIEEDIPVDQYY